MGPSSPHLAPVRKLSTATRMPKIRITAATPTSTARTDAAERSSPFSTSTLLDATAPAAGIAPAAERLRLPSQEPRFLHEEDVPRFLASDPRLVLLAVEGRLVERALLEEILPFRRLANLLHQVDVVLDLVRGHASRHEYAAQHEVFHVEPRLLAGGDIVPGHRLGDLVLVRHVPRVEHAQRPQSTRAPLGDRLD